MIVVNRVLDMTDGPRLQAEIDKFIEMIAQETEKGGEPTVHADALRQRLHQLIKNETERVAKLHQQEIHDYREIIADQKAQLYRLADAWQTLLSLNNLRR